MTTFVDYYKELGLLPRADSDTIKRRYRELAKLFHPDGLTPDEERFKRINNANEVLSDPARRADYDVKFNAHYATSSPGAKTGPTSGPTPRPRPKTGSAPPPPPPPPRPAPPPPPKVYNPVLAVDRDSFDDLTVQEGETAQFSFTVNHISGDLPPKWNIAVLDETGVLIKGATFSNFPLESLPTIVTVKLPSDKVGVFEEGFSIQLLERIGV